MHGTQSTGSIHVRGLLDLFPVILPLGLLAVMVVLLSDEASAATCSASPSLVHLPYITLSVAVLLGFFFAQTRVSFVGLLLLPVVFLLDRSFFVTGDTEGGHIVILVSAVYFPCLLGLFHQLHERGVLTSHGYVRIGILCSVIIVLVLLPRVDALRRIVASVRTDIVRPGHGLVRVPMIGIIAFIGCGVSMFVRNVNESPRLGPILGIAGLFVFVGLNFESGLWPVDCGRTVLLSFMSGAGLVLAWAVMESSWRHAHIDELTQLPGRRSLQHHLAKLGASYAVAVVDVDHFKRVNDRYGHDTGDQVLKFTAAMLGRNTAGRAYRQGGEEFVIVCDGSDYAATLAALDELRASIAGREFVVRGRDRPRKKPETPRPSAGGERQTLTVTVSIGVARRNRRYCSPLEVLEAADKALYRAKKAGRNCLKASR